MNRSADAAQDYLYLVICAANGEAPDRDKCAQMDLRAIYRLSCSQFLSSAVAVALERTIELPHAFDQVKKKAIRKLALFDIERANVLRALEQEGVWYLPLKGILIKDCYPKTAMREMSDNDILCDSGRMETVRSVMEGLGYTCESFGGYPHDTYSKPPTLEFEMHRTLFDKKEIPKFYSYYYNVKDRLVKDEGSEFGYHMTPDDSYIYLLCHMYKHYLYVGTGLRSLMDIYLFNKRYSDELDMEYISRELEKLELLKFEKNTRSFAEKVFTGQPLSQEEQKELDGFLSDGIYGKGENLKKYLLAKEIGGDSKKAKRRYLLRRAFPEKEYMEKRYPAVSRHKILYPLIWVYRPIKGVVKYPKTLIAEFKTVKHHKNPERRGNLDK